MGSGPTGGTLRRLALVRLAILAIGKMKDGPERALQIRYLDRARAIGRQLGYMSIDLIELPEGRAQRAEDRKAEEGRAILDRIDDRLMIALDENGDAPTSDEFALLLQDFNRRGEKLVSFVIGGADGLAQDVLARANKRIAFGAMTLPHQLARILLAEQIYRAMTLASGHPYHRA